MMNLHSKKSKRIISLVIIFLFSCHFDRYSESRLLNFKMIVLSAFVHLLLGLLSTKSIHPMRLSSLKSCTCIMEPARDFLICFNGQGTPIFAFHSRYPDEDIPLPFTHLSQISSDILLSVLISSLFPSLLHSYVQHRI